MHARGFLGDEQGGGDRLVGGAGGEEIEDLAFPRCEPAEGSSALRRFRERHAGAGGEPEGAALEVVGTDDVGSAPALDEELAALVPAAVVEQLGGQVQTRLEGEVAAEWLRQGGCYPELGDGRFTGEPGGVGLGERQLDPE